MEHSSRYIVLFAAGICLVCSILVSGSAVSLKPRQDRNKALDVQTKVLVLAGVLGEDEDAEPNRVEQLFADRIEAQVIELATGAYVTDIDPTKFDMQKAMKDVDTSREAPSNRAKVRRLPDNAVVYKVSDESGQTEALILPIEGMGLWGTLWGFLSLAPDANTIQGITYYKHKETPGLGGEVDNPRWRARWPGRKAFGADGSVQIRVKKGAAGPPETDPYQVDGLSGATLTSRGVTNMLAFWLSEDAFGPYLKQFKAEQGGS